MKDYSDAPNSDCSSVKKFRFVAPTKPSTTKNFFDKLNSPKPPISSNLSFDPDKAWSIRKDISLGFTAPQTTSSYGYNFTKRYSSPQNSVYSRHHTNSMKSVSDTDTVLRSSGNGTSSNLWSSWQSGRGAKLNSYKRDKPVASDDEFDFDLPSSNSQHFEKLPTENYSKSQQTDKLNSSPPVPSLPKKSAEINYSNKYNAAYYHL